MESKVAKRYANALFNAALKNDILLSVEDDLNGISNAMVADPNFKTFLMNPTIGREDKLKLMESVFSDRVTALTMQMIRLMLEKGREEEFGFLRLEFIKLRRAHESVIHAVVTSAKPMSKEEQDSVIGKISKETGKSVEPEFLVDAHLMGGVKVAYNDYVLDGTVRGYLNRLREKLVYDLLKQS